MDAVVFQRACGATSRPRTHVAIVPSGGAIPSEPGNVYIASQDIGIQAQWLGTDRLLLEVVMTQEHDYRSTTVKGIQIEVVDLAAGRFDSARSAPIEFTESHMARIAAHLIGVHRRGGTIPPDLASFLAPAKRIAPYHPLEYIALDAWERMPRLEISTDSVALVSAGADTSTTRDDIRLARSWDWGLSP